MTNAEKVKWADRRMGAARASAKHQGRVRTLCHQWLAKNKPGVLAKLTDKARQLP